MENMPPTPAAGDLAEQAFGRRVRGLRVAAGMTQAELAEKVTHSGINMRQGMIAKLERGARPTSVGEITILASVLGVPPSSLLLSDDAAPREVTSLLDMSMNATRTAATLQELIEQRQRMDERIAATREVLRTSVALYDKTLAIVVENHGAEWLASQGLDNVSLASQNNLFVKLGAYGDNSGPVDEYVRSHLRS